MPEDGEIVDVLRYGKIKTMRFYKPYMAFNPYSSYARLEGWVLGVWQRVDPKDLIIPLDVHVHNVALELGLTSRKRADMKAAMEVTEVMRQIFPDDPARGDFALFGYGIEKIKD